MDAVSGCVTRILRFALRSVGENNTHIYEIGHETEVLVMVASCWPPESFVQTVDQPSHQKVSTLDDAFAR